MAYEIVRASLKPSERKEFDEFHAGYKDYLKKHGVWEALARNEDVEEN